MKSKHPTTRSSIATFVGALCLVAAASAAHADDQVQVGFSAEPGDPAFSFVPASVSPDEVIVVLIDRTGPITSGVVLLTRGRSVAFAGVESHPFAITESYTPGMIAFAEK